MRHGPKVLFAVLVSLAVFPAAAQAGQFSPWTTAEKIDEIGGNSSELNTPYQDGCPIQSPDGLSLYLASNRPGGQGSLDIWVARRESKSAPWGAPENLGEPVNSAADEFCPTPVGRNGPVLRQPGGVARELWDGRHLLHAPPAGRHLA